MPLPCGRCSRRPNRSSTWPRPAPGWRAPKPAAPARPASQRPAPRTGRSRSTRGGRVMAGVAVAAAASVVARGHRWRPGLPQPLPAVAVRGRPGDRRGRPLARRAHQLRDGHRRIVDHLPARSRMPPRPAAAAGLSAPVVADLPAGIAGDADVRRRLRRRRDLHVRRGPRAGGRGTGGRSAARRCRRGSTAACSRCRSRPRWWSRTASTRRRCCTAAAACPRVRHSSSSRHAPRRCPRPA